MNIGIALVLVIIFNLFFILLYFMFGGWENRVFIPFQNFFASFVF